MVFLVGCDERGAMMGGLIFGVLQETLELAFGDLGVVYASGGGDRR